jgi:hypothetical protein
VIGTTRVATNLIDEFGFNGGSSKGGKGGSAGSSSGSGGKKSGTKQYHAYVDWALCQGPISFSGSAFNGGGANAVWSNGGQQAANMLALNYYDGADGQAADPTFTAQRGLPVPNYSGTAHATGTPLQLGSTPALPQVSFQITGFFAHTAGTSLPDDALPSLAIEGMLTDPRWGCGFPAANVADLTDYGAFCQSHFLGISLLMDRQQQCARWIEEIAQLTTSALFFSGSLLKVVPYPEAAWSGNGAAWTPNLTPVYSIGDDDFIAAPSDDPDSVTLTDQSQATNWLSLEYMPIFGGADGQNYNPQIVSVWDQAAIDTYGIRTEPSIQGHEFSDSGAAQTAAQLMLNRKLYIRERPITFKLPLRYCLLEPMDVVALTDPYLGWDQKVVRITSIAEDENGELSIEAEGFAGLSTPQRPAVQGGVGTLAIDPNMQPGATNTPLIFEPPFALTNGATEVWIVATGEPPNWGGCQVWVSLDGSSYQEVGTILLGGRQGALTATFASGSDPDTTHTLSVDLTECQGQLLSASQAEADALVTLCYVDGELIAYERATLTTAFNYDIDTYIRRGAYASPITSHATDSQFARVSTTDNTVFRYAYAPSFAGETIFVKLTAFNLLGLQLQDPADVEPFAYVLSGAGIQPAEFLIAGAFSGRPTSLQAFSYVFVGNRSLPLNLSGSHGAAGIAGTVGSTVFAIAKNGTNFGTMTFAASATTATFSATAQSFIAGDVLTVTAPNVPNATLANIAWTLKGT